MLIQYGRGVHGIKVRELMVALDQLVGYGVARRVERVEPYRHDGRALTTRIYCELAQ